MKKLKIFIPVTAALLSIMMILSGCGKTNNSSSQSSVTLDKSDTALSESIDDMFSDRDFEVGYDESTATKITISDSNPDIKITEAGTYIISGTSSNGSITVDVPDTDKVQIVLNGVSVTSKTSAALYVKSADKVFVTTVKDTENTLENGGTFTAIDDNNIDGAIFSKSDITFNGEGTLTIKSPSAHAVVGKDDVKFTSGTYKLSAAKHGVDANDSIRIANAAIEITAGEDGLHSENNDDNEKGYIYIKSGTITVNAGDDGIHATTTLQIDGGTLDITAAEGLEATVIQINDGTIDIKASDDGINAAKKSTIATPAVEINGGKITIVMGAGDTDGIDANGNITINGGTIDITANSPFDYDGTGTLNAGTVIVNGSEVTTIQNQMMGGGGMGGGMPNGMKGNMMPADPNTIPDNGNGNTEGTMPQSPNGQMKERPQMPSGDGSTESGTKRQKPSADSTAEGEVKRQKPTNKSSNESTPTDAQTNTEKTSVSA